MSQRADNMDHRAPTAMMRRLQEFNGIPVDPQIDPRIIQQPHGGHYGSSDDYTGAHRVTDNGYVDLDMDDDVSQPGSQHRHMPMAMATERHIRKGDEPGGYQTEGLAHDEERMQDGDEYKSEREMDFQELLRGP